MKIKIVKWLNIYDAGSLKTSFLEHVIFERAPYIKMRKKWAEMNECCAEYLLSHEMCHEFEDIDGIFITYFLKATFIT